MNNLHKEIVKVGVGKLSVSLPDIGSCLGRTIRVFGDLEDLLLLNNDNIISGVKVELHSPKVVPDEHFFGVFSRVQQKKTMAKLRSGIKSGHITDEKAYRIKMASELINLPFFNLTSGSNGQQYKRFIKFSHSDHKTEGVFDSFGMSSSATVPIF